MLPEATWPTRAGDRDRFLHPARTHQIHAARCRVTNTEVEKMGSALGKRKVQLGGRQPWICGHILMYVSQMRTVTNQQEHTCYS